MATGAAPMDLMIAPARQAVASYGRVFFQPDHFCQPVVAVLSIAPSKPKASGL